LVIWLSSLDMSCFNCSFENVGPNALSTIVQIQSVIHELSVIDQGRG
jgi:hypothetical protein